jgi:hypothetical protein
MKVKRSLLVAAFLVAFAVGPALVAQEAPPPPPTPPAAIATEPEKPKTKSPFGLYVGVGYGQGSAKDLDVSNQTLSSHTTTTTFSLDDQSYAQAVFGWHLGNNNGDFRLVFNGYSENSFQMTSTGLSGLVQDPVGNNQPQFHDNLPWWQMTIKDGHLLSVRSPQIWIPGEDTNGNQVIDPDEPANSDTNRNGFVDLGEQTALPPDLTIDRPFSDNLQNRAQHWDALYGNSWGPRNFRGRWWAGLRYFQYEGNVLGTGWLAVTPAGYGFTDGAFFHVLNYNQKTTGGGPTASLEMQFRFFRERLALFAMGQAAFVVLNLELDSGPFFTIVQDTTGANIPAAAQLTESLSKSTWQTTFEGGVRWRFNQREAKGLELELVYNKTGYLDSVLLPTSLRIPASDAEARFGTSAIYRTQDLVFDAWRFGVSFQF